MEKIKAFAREQGYDDVMYLTKWRGYDCYEPIFKDTEVAYVGLPLMIMVQGETIRMSTVDEALAQISEQN
jgi:hypothetical protein